MIPSEAPNDTPTGDFMLRGARSNTFGYRNSSTFSVPAITVEKAHNFDVAGSMGGIVSSLEKGSASSRNPKRDSMQREPDCVPEIGKVGKRGGFAVVGSNCNNPSDIAPLPLLSSNPNQKIAWSKAPPDYLVRLLNCSGWKVVFHSSESYVYISPSGQEYSSIAEVLEVFLQGTNVFLQGTNEVRDADMERSLDTAKMDLIRTSEETNLQDMTTSKQVKPMVLSSKDNAKSKSASASELNQMPPIENPIKENGDGSFQRATLVTKKGRKGHKTINSPVANVLPKVQKTCIADDHSKDNSKQSSYTNVGIEHRNSVGGSGLTVGVRKGMPLPPGAVLALPAFNNISLDGKTSRPGLSSPSTKRSDIKKMKQTVVDDGSDRRREAPLSTMKDGNKQIKSPVVNVTNDRHSKNDDRNSGSTNAGVRDGNKPGNSLQTNKKMNKKKTLAPASVLETHSGMEGRSMNGDATMLDCRSSVLPSQPKTSPIQHQGNTIGVRKSDLIQRKHGLADDDSQNQFDWQQIAFQLFGRTSQANTSPIQDQGDTVGSRRSDPVQGRQVRANDASKIFSPMNMQGKPH